MHNEFNKLVILKLPALSQEAALNKKDPDGMTEDEKRRIRRDIKDAVFGE